MSPGCDNCYAESESKRRGWAEWGANESRHFTSDAYWKQPIRWNKQAELSGVRQRVFCGSLCDVMEDRQDLIAQRLRLYDLILQTPHLDWLLLTKRPQNFRRFLPSSWLRSPRFNVWLMTTVESQAQDWRLRELLKTPALVRGISYEPAVGPLDLTHAVRLMSSLEFVGTGGFLGLHWVITGGESGSHARSMPVEWARSMRVQCKHAGIPFFFKQGSADWGKEFKQFSAFPPDLQIQELPRVEIGSSLIV